jgi:hypothetical protein
MASNEFYPHIDHTNDKSTPTETEQERIKRLLHALITADRDVLNEITEANPELRDALRCTHKRIGKPPCERCQ